jgi:hypothetical protein
MSARPSRTLFCLTSVDYCYIQLSNYIGTGRCMSLLKPQTETSPHRAANRRAGRAAQDGYRSRPRSVDAVIPANAGIQFLSQCRFEPSSHVWIPAFGGMTSLKRPGFSQMTSHGHAQECPCHRRRRSSVRWADYWRASKVAWPSRPWLQESTRKECDATLGLLWVSCTGRACPERSELECPYYGSACATR